MKAITLYQPWATLIANGSKQIETRSWKTAYRGPLAIHSGAIYYPENKSLSLTHPFYESLRNEPADVTGKYGGWLPAGYILAICDLIDCIKIKEETWEFFYHQNVERKFNGIVFFGEMKMAIIPPGQPELSFGDYTPGRYAWILSNVKRLKTPIPARGNRMIWEWNDLPFKREMIYV